MLRAIALVALVVLSCWGIVSCDESTEYDENGVALSETAVPAPAAVDAAEVATQLAAAERAQDICYGWHLKTADGQTVSAGSNLGVGQDVGSSDYCPQWVKVEVTVRYTAESSEINDYVSILVRTAGSLGGGYAGALTRLGLTEQRFLDDPADSTLRAALALPLLVAENGKAAPVPAPTAAATTPEPLPAASSDFWRNNSTGIWVAVISVLIGAWFVGYGFFAGRRNQAEDARRAVLARRKATAAPKKRVRKRPR